jgi:Mg-chelatase subunit ChlD
MSPRSLAAALLLTAATTSSALAERSVLMVLDASGSMTQKLADGQTRFDAAKSAIDDALAKMPDTYRVGLRVYGHQSATAQRNCDDTALVTPMGAAGQTRGAISAAVRPLAAKGYTPITLSLEKAAGDIMGEANAQKVIVLVSDGRETCKGDPCATAKALAAADASLVIHTIGFGVDAAARAQLQCIASVARGTYYDANTRKDLGDQLGEASRKAKVEPPKEPAPKVKTGKIFMPGMPGPGGQPDVLNAENDESVTGPGRLYSGGLELPPGIYNLKMRNGLWRGVEVKAGATTVLKPGFLVFKPDNMQHRDLYKIMDSETDEELGDMIIHALDRHTMIPGRFHVEIDGFAFKNVEFKPGEVTVVSAGLLKIKDALHENHFYKISSLDGAITRTFASSNPITIPPGRYSIRDHNDDNRPAFEIDIPGGVVTTATYP